MTRLFVRANRKNDADIIFNVDNISHIEIKGEVIKVYSSDYGSESFGGAEAKKFLDAIDGLVQEA